MRNMLLTGKADPDGEEGLDAPTIVCKSEARHRSRPKTVLWTEWPKRTCELQGALFKTPPRATRIGCVQFGYPATLITHRHSPHRRLTWLATEKLRAEVACTACSPPAENPRFEEVAWGTGVLAVGWRAGLGAVCPSDRL